MQQGHPRNNQLRRARHEMYLHNRHKAEGVWNANYKHQPIGNFVLGPTVITSARIESLSGLKLY